MIAGSAYLTGAIFIGPSRLLEARVGRSQGSLQQAQVIAAVALVVYLLCIRIAARVTLLHHFSLFDLFSVLLPARNWLMFIEIYR